MLEVPLELPVPDDPLLEVPLLDVPLLDVPLLDVPVLVVLLLPDDPLLGGVKGIVPPPHPTRKITANIKALVLSMNCPLMRG